MTIREIIARALAEHNASLDPVWENWLPEADVVIAALEKAGPTEQMKLAGEKGWCEMANRTLPERASDCWRAMLASAQEKE
ncbi:MAG: hypothetical protein C4523_02610 [Myxococcales bacterium]|jgi:hypothetical protein|nr:MAG: hypothetical protein C4523_02610 [Myxococcales bacterium]